MVEYNELSHKLHKRITHNAQSTDNANSIIFVYWSRPNNLNYQIVNCNSVDSNYNQITDVSWPAILHASHCV